MKNKTKIILCTTLGIMASLYGMQQQDQAQLNAQLIAALGYDPLAEVERLLAEGANPEIIYNNEPLLVYAAEQGNSGLVKILIAANANVNVTDNHKKVGLILDDTPLIIAAGTPNINRLIPAQLDIKVPKYIDVIRYLIAAGADINAKNKIDFTPLMRAAYVGIPVIVKELIDSGANVLAISYFGETALQLAQSFKARHLPALNTEIVGLLQNAEIAAQARKKKKFAGKKG